MKLRACSSSSLSSTAAAASITGSSSPVVPTPSGSRSSGSVGCIGILASGVPVPSCSGPVLLRSIGLVVVVTHVGHVVVHPGRFLVALCGSPQRPCGVLMGLVNVLSSVGGVVGARSGQRRSLLELSTTAVQLLDPLADPLLPVPQLVFQPGAVHLSVHSPPPFLASDK